MNIYQSKEFAEAWDKYQSEKKDAPRTRLMNSILLKNIGKLNNKLVLEAGCGNGFFIEYLLKLNPKQIHAFDISPHLVKIAKQKYKTVNFKVADLTKKLPYKDKQFDCITCYNVLMEPPEIQTAIKELKRITKDGGHIHIVIVHPLYNLFINDPRAKSESIIERLKHYTKEEKIFVDTIKGFGKFAVYRRPISFYIGEFIKNKLTIEKMIEVPISKNLAKLDKKYEQRINIPVFIYFKLKKTQT